MQRDFKQLVPRLPDLLCIGAQKAGTSWFHETFGLRSDIWIPHYKEMHFFDYKFVDNNRGWIGPHRMNNLNAARRRHGQNHSVPDPHYLAYLDAIEAGDMDTLDWYRYVFSPAGADQIALDVTPEYSCIPQSGVEYVAEVLPNAKFVYIIRDPLDRAISQLRMNVSRRLRNKPDAKINWKNESQNGVLLNRGNYREYVPRWESVFGRDRLLFVPFGKIKSDPVGLFRQVEQLMGLEPTEYKMVDRVVHKTQPLDVPDHAIDHLREALAPQYQFLKQHFSAEFVANMK